MKVKSIMAKFTKKELGKIKPGTFITLKWNDAPLETVMLLEKIDVKQKGDISLRYFSDLRHINSFATHKQIVGVMNEVVFPDPIDQADSAEDRSNNYLRLPR